MASALPAAHISPARIGQSTFMGLAWGSVALTVLFFTFRIIVRLKVFGRLHADDGLVFFAWIVLLINTILWQFGQDALYENIAVSSGQLYPPPPGFAHAAEQYLRRSVAVIVFFYTGLWSVKFSFLVFFKRLGHNCGGLFWQLLSPLILVPINLLWKVQLSFRKKFALGGIFCITVIIMVFAIIRAIVVSSYSQELDETWLYMWSSIEQAVFACLASFPSLFEKSERAKHQRLPDGNAEGHSDATSRYIFFFSRKSKASQESPSDIVMNKTGQQQASTMTHGSNGSSALWNQHQKPSFHSSEHIPPMNKAHIDV
ncbi:hypothetical protein HO133_002130 [Letharia lupina]|uniref:Rhodopsin domain-containing protein n=1 Tax=Letharia lupina TaxID=560253 RepID=A0A8H6CD94_9LECA|nr:uncharacterized protein HO133_002130 [Letharia lupina]KAF6221275.1 hypothetical protein HO133_002130 [Letharia lupina]